MEYAYAKNGYGERALKNGKPILYPSSSSGGASIRLKAEQTTFSDGWCETVECWVVDRSGMGSAAFKKACHIGTN